MRLLLALVTLSVLVYATKKSDFMQKIVNMGVKIPTKQQMNQLGTCMETPVYQQRSMDNLTSTGMDCGMNVMASSFGDLMNLYNSMETCLEPCKTNTIALVTKIAMSNTALGLGKFGELNTVISNCKKNKKPKATCIENMYGWGQKQFNKTSVNQYCTNLVKNCGVNKCEWKCMLTVGKKLVDFSPYKCATLTPADKC